MGKEISLFSRYSQGENRTTNYCLLIFKLLYEENPSFLSELMENLIGEEEVSEAIGVEFTQQQRYADSIPDGVISQPPLDVFLETKEGSHFSHDQLRRHVDALYDEGKGVRLLLCLGKLESEDDRQFEAIETYCEQELDGLVLVAHASYEKLADSLELSGLPKNLMQVVGEFRSYLDEENLLPSWRTRLDVVNCARNLEMVVKDRIYMCPARGGAYSHRRSKFFGAYKDKAAQYVAEIEAVVDLSDEEPPEFKWKNREVEEEAALERARSARERRRPEDEPATRVFLLGEFFDTEFLKDTKHGMQGSKQYFDVSLLQAEDARALAEELRGRAWSSLT